MVDTTLLPFSMYFCSLTIYDVTSSVHVVLYDAWFKYIIMHYFLYDKILLKLLQANNPAFLANNQIEMTYFTNHSIFTTQRPRTDLNNSFLPRPNTTTV